MYAADRTPTFAPINRKRSPEAASAFQKIYSGMNSDPEDEFDEVDIRSNSLPTGNVYFSTPAAKAMTAFRKAVMPFPTDIARQHIHETGSIPVPTAPVSFARIAKIIIVGVLCVYLLSKTIHFIHVWSVERTSYAAEQSIQRAMHKECAHPENAGLETCLNQRKFLSESPTYEGFVRAADHITKETPIYMFVQKFIENAAPMVLYSAFFVLFILVVLGLQNAWKTGVRQYVEVNSDLYSRR